VEYTGRHFVITPAIKKNVETGLHKIKKILGGAFEASVILALEKHRHKAEITITPRNGTIVGLAEAKDMTAAVGDALEHLEKQALKHRARSRTKKRHPKKKWDGLTVEEAVSQGGSADGESVVLNGKANGKSTAVPLVVHKFQARTAASEIHVVSSGDSIAPNPMTLEEAVKEAHFRDRDVFVFRDKKGKVKILHRTRDGKMELIEAP
jgi:putative sigma-54 modulation protein